MAARGCIAAPPAGGTDVRTGAIGFELLLLTGHAALATLLAVNRMSADSEIIALKAAGISIARLFYPVVIIGLLCTLGTGLMTLHIIPRSVEWSEKLKVELVRTSARAGVRVKGFVGMGDMTTLYVDAIEGDVLKGVMLARTASKKKNAEGPNTIFVFAKEGHMTSDPDELINYLRLRDGEIQAADWDGKIFRKISFGAFDVKIDLTKKEKKESVERGTMFELMDLKTLKKREKEIKAKLAELKGKKKTKAAIERYNVALRQIEISRHQKFSLPIACLILALWGIPLGIQPPRTTRHQGVITSIFLTLTYYVVVTGGKILAVKGHIPASIALWAPNALVVTSGVVFIYLVSNDKPLPLSAAMGRAEEIYSVIAEKFGWKKPT